MNNNYKEIIIKMLKIVEWWYNKLVARKYDLNDDEFTVFIRMN